MIAGLKAAGRGAEMTRAQDSGGAGGPGGGRVGPSILSADLTITGSIRTSGELRVEGRVEGDVQAHAVTIGAGATVEGEVIADDVLVDGKVIGRLRAVKVRLRPTADVAGDIVHQIIAIESGARFEGAVKRRDDPRAGGDRPAGR